MKEETQRTAQYAKDPGYELAVAKANAILGAAEIDHAPPARPVLLIAGLPRSGTTLLYQVLAASGGFGYCSNLMARFYERPALGALVQSLLAPWLPPESPDFSSRAGGTDGWSRPHEFGYFWERHCRLADDHQPDVEALDLSRMSALLGELEETVDRPLLLKNVILSFLLTRLAQDLPTLRIIRIRRRLLDVAVSIANVRREYFGDVTAWFSVRPAGTHEILSADAPHQIAFQIARVEEALAVAQAALGPERWLEIDYASLCADPRAVARSAATFADLDPARLAVSLVPERFAISTAQAESRDASRAFSLALAAMDLHEEESGR